MPLNVPGILVPFQLLLYPRLVIPALVVNDIRQVDFLALKRAGYRGAVFDKDNCLTLPHRDTLVPELQESWKSCRETFGEGNVLIVSNSAGTYLDAGGIQSESVAYHLGVPVLSHKSLKPAYSCITAIRTYFSSLRFPIHDHQLIVVGDRVFTDIVLGNRMRMQANRHQTLPGVPLSSNADKTASIMEEEANGGTANTPNAAGGPLSILTTGVWQKESMTMRWLELRLVHAVERFSKPLVGEPMDVSSFVNEVVKPVSPPKRGVLGYLVSRFTRA
ncbi:hypothetical protein GALMADRAFT_97324 [Galerina marginata CBS 339.88]|uniref:Uncharacterized protein n=1 Tax=Galerina marginata (strain CBS 339.88) TaxID=685588 RepID=A0A067T6R8_GALM3|nr:hypothetical protein GALMADRAFT_97324 [Galerina marginata CBS 339.88]